jgi:hypothetical protein
VETDVLMGHIKTEITNTAGKPSHGEEGETKDRCPKHSPRKRSNGGKPISHSEVAIVCRAVTMGQPPYRQIYQNHFEATARQTRSQSNESTDNNRGTVEKAVFLRGPCRGVILKTTGATKSVPSSTREFENGGFQRMKLKNIHS